MRKALTYLGQAVLLGVVGWFVWRALDREIAELGRLDFPLTLDWPWVVLSWALTMVTYVVLIHAWRTVLGGWAQSIPFRRAARIWTLSNLGRYVPGKVWSVAGLAVLAQREGIAGWAAGASAVLMQFIALGTGAAVVAATSEAAGVRLPVHSTVLWVVGFLSVGVVAFLATSEALSRAGRTFRSDLAVRPLAPRAAVLAVTAAAVSWALHGVALWLLARGLLGEIRIAPGTAVSAFTSAYIVGLLAVMVPGGIGVREGTLAVLLGPSIGAGAALALAVASRVVMTVAELTAAAFATLGAGAVDTKGSG